MLQQVSFVERLSLYQRVRYWRFHYIPCAYCDSTNTHTNTHTHTHCSPSTFSCVRLSTLSYKTRQTNNNSFRLSGNLLKTSSKSGKTTHGRSQTGPPSRPPPRPPSPCHPLLLLPVLHFHLMLEQKLLWWLVGLQYLTH